MSGSGWPRSVTLWLMQHHVTQKLVPTEKHNPKNKPLSGCFPSERKNRATPRMIYPKSLSCCGCAAGTKKFSCQNNISAGRSPDCCTISWQNDISSFLIIKDQNSRCLFFARERQGGEQERETDNNAQVLVIINLYAPLRLHSWAKESRKTKRGL